jgi:hypothetical protein
VARLAVAPGCLHGFEAAIEPVPPAAATAAPSGGIAGNRERGLAAISAPVMHAAVAVANSAIRRWREERGGERASDDPYPNNNASRSRYI